MQPPNDAEVFELKLCTLWVDKDGILNSIAKPVQRTMTNSRELVEFVQKISHGERICVLSDISRSAGFDKDAREYLNKEIPKVFKAMALLTNSYLGKIVGNIILAFIKPDIPTCQFINESEAQKWLLEMQKKK